MIAAADRLVWAVLGLLAMRASLLACETHPFLVLTFFFYILFSVSCNIKPEIIKKKKQRKECFLDKDYHNGNNLLALIGSAWLIFRTDNKIPHGNHAVELRSNVSPLFSVYLHSSAIGYWRDRYEEKGSEGWKGEGERRRKGRRERQRDWEGGT